MDIVAHNSEKNKRYIPHEVRTRIHAVQLYRQEKDIDFVCRRYHISKSSLMRWNRQYDGTRKSLTDKSHRPHSAHPNAHTQEELTWIRNYHRRNPNISICERYGIVGIRVHCTACSSDLDTAGRQNQQRKSLSTTVITTHRRNWGKSGKWM